MSVETLQYIELAAYIVAALFLIAAIVLFFVLKIPAVVGDLTGSTARKAIESIRQQNENAANADKNKNPTVSPTYSEMNKTSATSRMKKKSGAAPGATMKMATNELTNQAMAAAEAANATTVLAADQLPMEDSGATTVLTADQLPVEDSGATTVLTADQLPMEDSGATTVLTADQLPMGDSGATTVLTQDQLPGFEDGATTVLTPDQLRNTEDTPVPTPQVSFTIDVEMGFAESTETIE